MDGITIDWSILSGDSPSADYFYDLSGNGSVSLDPSTGQASVSITAIDDTIDEYDENFRVHLTATSPYGYSDLGTYDVVLQDNDAAPTLTLQRFDSSGQPLDNVVPESLGYGGAGGAAFSVVASHPSEKPFSLEWSTSHGTATGIDLSVAGWFDTNAHDEDFDLISTSTSLWTGSPSSDPFVTDVVVGEIEIAVNDDVWHEGPETFDILMSATNASVASSSLTVTIDDTLDDTPVVYVQPDFSASEDDGQGGNGQADVPISLSNPSLSVVTVDFATTDGEAPHPAVAGEDYSAASGTVTFTVGETTKPAAVEILNDTLWPPRQEWAPPEHFFLDISGPTNAILPSEASSFGRYWYGTDDERTQVTIVDEQSFPNLTVTMLPDPSGDVPEGGTAQFELDLGEYAFEDPTTLQYTAYWDFYDHRYWQWAGGIPQGLGCITHYDPPLISERTSIAGEVEFLPGGTSTFVIDVPGLSANGLRDPSRFIRIDFEWAHDPGDPWYYYPDPASVEADLADDTPVPQLTAFTVTPDTIFESDDYNFERAADVALTFDNAWSVPMSVELSASPTGSANADDFRIGHDVGGGTFLLSPGQSSVVFSLNAVDDGFIESPETLVLHVMTDTYEWGLAADSSTAVNIVDSGPEESYVNILPEQQDQQIIVKDDRLAGQAVGAVVIDSNAGPDVTWSTNGPFELDGTIIRYTGAAAIAAGENYAFSVTGTVLSADGAATFSDTETYTISVIAGNQPPVFLSQNPLVAFPDLPVGSIVGQVAATDPDGNAIQYALDSPNPNLPFEIDPVRGLIRTTADFLGAIESSYTFDVVVADRDPGHIRQRAATSAFTVTVEPSGRTINQPPVAVADSAIAEAGTAVTINVLANDGEFEGEALSGLQIVDAPQSGTATVVADPVTGLPVIEYTAAADGNGQYALTYQVTDAHGNEALGILTVSVSGSEITDRTIAADVVLLDDLDTLTFVNALRDEGFYIDLVSAFDADVMAEASVLLGEIDGGVALYAAQDGVLSTDFDLVTWKPSGLSWVREWTVNAESLGGELVFSENRVLAPSSLAPSFPVEHGGLEPIKEWAADPPPGTTLDAFQFTSWRTSCDTGDGGAFPKAALMELAGHRALFLAGIPLREGAAASDFGTVLGNAYDWLSAALPTPSGTAEIPEHTLFTTAAYSATGTVIGNLPVDATTSFALTDGNSAVFTYNAGNGEISLANAALLKAGTRQELQFDVIEDSSVVGTMIVTVLINWPNRAPSIETPVGPFALLENSLPGTAVGQVTATDPDGGPLTFDIIGGNTGNAFTIDNDGHITVAADNSAIDFEQTPTFTLQVRVTDDVSWNPLTDTINVTVNLQDISIEIDASGLASVPENSPNGTVIGSLSPQDWTGSGPPVLHDHLGR